MPAFAASAFCIYLFQGYQTEMSNIMGEEATMIDMRSGYTLTEISDFFTKLKSEGRAIHRYATGVTDMIFPLAYGPLFILIIAFFLKKIVPKNSNWMYLSLFPVLVMITDYFENFNTLKMLESYPALTSEMVNDAASVTDLKSLLVNISIILPLILAILWGIKWFRAKKTPIADLLS